MYCVKCGVELADSERSCPLCGTKVYYPEAARGDAEPPYPEFVRNDTKMNRRSILFIISIVFLAVIAQLIICEVSISGAKGWAGFAVGAVVLFYILVVLPMWFRRPNPVIIVPCDHAAILLYLMYIDLLTGGHWFLLFAMPTVTALALIMTAATAIIKYMRGSLIYVCGGAVIAYGGFMVLLEFLLNLTFGISSKIKWSYFPLFGCLIIGLGILVIAMNKPLRESFQKKFYF